MDISRLFLLLVSLCQAILFDYLKQTLFKSQGREGLVLSSQVGLKLEQLQ